MQHTEENVTEIMTQRYSQSHMPRNYPIVKNLAKTATSFRDIISQHNPFEKRNRHMTMLNVETKLNNVKGGVDNNQKLIKINNLVKT
jgi:hypothetical protein